jgi:hypothetical protein
MFTHLTLRATVAALALAATPAACPTPDIPETITMQANGTFEVRLAPQPAASGIEPAALGRQTIDKRFHGDLEATSLGEMLSVMSAAQGSGAYVALERVTGTLGGRRGSFVLMHSATMTRGAPAMAVTVVPDSGTEELAGLSGTLTISIDAAGGHAYAFHYSLPPP